MTRIVPFLISVLIFLSLFAVYAYIEKDQSPANMTVNDNNANKKLLEIRENKIKESLAQAGESEKAEEIRDKEILIRKSLETAKKNQ